MNTKTIAGSSQAQQYEEHIAQMQLILDKVTKERNLYRQELFDTFDKFVASEVKNTKMAAEIDSLKAEISLLKAK